MSTLGKRFSGKNAYKVSYDILVLKTNEKRHLSDFVIGADTAAEAAKKVKYHFKDMKTYKLIKVYPPSAPMINNYTY